MRNYRHLYGMQKQAVGGLLDSVIKGFTDLGVVGSVYLLGATMLAGAGAGYLAAKATAHGAQDIDLAKKEYENERLKADIGYLSSQIKTEYDNQKNKTKPRSARVIA